MKDHSSLGQFSALLAKILPAHSILSAPLCGVKGLGWPQGESLSIQPLKGNANHQVVSFDGESPEK